MKRSLAIFLAVILTGCAAAPEATTSPITATSAPATTTPLAVTIATTVAATVPVATTTPRTLAATTSTTSSQASIDDDPAQEILTIFKEEYGSMFEVELVGKGYYFKPFGEIFLNDFNEANAGKKTNINALSSFSTGLAEVTDSFPDILGEYSVSVLNPLNTKNVLFVIKNGEVEYNFLDDIEVIPGSSTNATMSETEQKVFDLFEEIYGEDYVIRFEDTVYYLDPINKTIIAGMEMAMQGQKIGLDFWAQLKDNFNVVTSNFPEDIKVYRIQVTNPTDKTKILFVSQEGETYYDAFEE